MSSESFWVKYWANDCLFSFKPAVLLRLHFPQYQEWAPQPLVPVEEAPVEEAPAVEAPAAPVAWAVPSVLAKPTVCTHLPPTVTSSTSAAEARLISSSVQVA